MTHQVAYITSSLSDMVLTMCDNQFLDFYKEVLSHKYSKVQYMGQVTEMWLFCYLVLLSIDSKTR